MYNFLVVDDEKHIRDSVASIIKSINNDNVLQADNGATALRIMEQEQIDAVILDIRMPIIDGISFLKKMREYANSRDVAVAILSGYDEFEYARQVMSYGVIDYILKPFTRGDIMKIYYKIVRKLKNRNLLDKEIADLVQRSNEIKPLIKQRFFIDLIQNNITLTEFEKQRNFLNLSIKSQPIRVALVEIDTIESELLSQSDDNEIRLFKIMDIIQNIVSEWIYCDCFSISSNIVSVVWCPANIEKDLPYFIENIELLINEMAEIYKVILNVGIGETVKNPLNLKQSYDSAFNALKYKLLYGSGQIFDTYNLPDQREKAPLSFRTEEVIEKIWLNKPEEAIKSLSDYLDSIRSEPDKYHVLSIQLLLSKLLIDCLILLEKECDNLDSFIKKQGTNLLNMNFSNQSINQVEKFFTSLIRNICKEIMNNRNDSGKNAVFKAKQIILQKYNTPINVESIAKELHYSKNYFGQLFKAETGMFVNEYINLIRIQKAKELLASKKYYLYEIANLVGFEDQQYFTRVFKKIVGVSPSEYRV
ncbi:MAG TPA: response regulator [Clostridiaceae bacterium]|nr:response regulator [Clostridiaceae bacterium]